MTRVTPYEGTPLLEPVKGVLAAGDDWHFNLDTKATGISAGTWQLKATLSDGSTHTVWIA